MRYAHHKRVVSAVSLFCLCLFLFGFADMDAVDWYARGMDNLGQDLYGDAAEAFSNAITLDPVYQPAYFERGTVYLRMGQYDLAITDLTEAVDLKPDDSQAYYNRGLAYSLSGDYGSAVGDFSETIRLQPGRDDAYFERGSAYERLGQFDNAGRDLTRACDLGNDSACDAYDALRQRIQYYEYGVQ